MTSSYRIVVICEGSGDRDVAEGLTQSVLAQLVNWETTGLIAFRGLELNEGFSTWGGLPERAKGRVPRRNGFREAFTLDAFATWRALKLASTPEVDADGVILLRDSDKESERRSSIEAGVREFTANNKTKIRIAIGVATAKIEAWLISALDSDSDARRALRKELGFDVVTNAHELDASQEGARRDAKRVLAVLEPHLSPAEIISAAPIDSLLSNGSQTGLPEFLCSVRCNLGRLVANHIPDVDWCACPSP